MRDEEEEMSNGEYRMSNVEVNGARW